MNLAPFQTLRALRQHPLTRQQPWAAAARYLRWQVGSRICARPVVVDFVNDARLLVRTGMTGATGNIYAGLHEYVDMSFVLHALRPGDLFIDVGANVGTYTVLAAKVARADVVAFEPIPSSGRALRDNLALNGIEAHVELHQACVGARAGVVVMTAERDTTNHVVDGGGGNTEATLSVPVETLDGVLGERQPFLIKIDVEGYEHEVLRGAQRTLERPNLQAIIMEVNGSGERYARSDAELIAALTERGFVRCAYAPRARTLQPFAGVEPGCNALFVRDREAVQRRLTAAAAFRVLDQEI